jgi:hypothetical protein
LSFALGKMTPGPVGEVAGPDMAEHPRGPLFLSGLGTPPEIDLRFASREDDFARGLFGFDFVAEAGVDKADGAAEGMR